MNISNKIDELNKEISNLLWEKNRDDLNYKQRLDIDHQIELKKEELYKLLDKSPIFNDLDNIKDKNK